MKYAVEMNYVTGIEVEFAEGTKIMPILHKTKNVKSALLGNCVSIEILFTNGTEKVNAEFLVELGDEYTPSSDFDFLDKLIMGSEPIYYPYYETELCNLGDKTWVEGIHVNPIEMGNCVAT